MAPWLLTLSAFLASLTNISTAQWVDQIFPSDPRILYEPPYCGLTSHIVSQEPCPGTWGDIVVVDGEAIRITSGPSPSYGNVIPTFSFSFYGSAIELHCCLDNNGAAFNVNLDSHTVLVNTSTGLGFHIVQQPYTAWTSLGLDPSINHTLTITFVPSFQPTYLYFEYLRVVTSAPGSSSSQPPTSTSLPTQSVHATSSSKLSLGPTIGIAVAAGVGVICLAAAIFLVVRLLRRPRVEEEGLQAAPFVVPTFTTVPWNIAPLIPEPLPSAEGQSSVTASTSVVHSSSPSRSARKARSPPEYSEVA